LHAVVKGLWLDPFLDFIGHLTIISKEIEHGGNRPVPLLEVLYGAQRRFLRHVCTGLDNGIHSFVCLKARQLGISTISLAIDCFWLCVHEGLQGALITDTEANKENFRLMLEHYLTSLPPGLRVGIKKHNRNALVLANGSVLSYLVAGTKKTVQGLGRSRALNFVHATEVSSWGSHEGVASLQAALAQKHPNRLYIWESTARGMNLFKDMWDDAKADQLTQCPFFIGWWSKEDYSFDKGSREYKEYWDGKLDEVEAELVGQVASQYNHRITPGQIAWHRWMRTVRIPDPDMMDQEYPWTEQQAFILTGKSFFPLKRVAEDRNFLESSEAPLKAYAYTLGENFLSAQMEAVDTTHEADLRVWEEPNPAGVYVMGVDPAYGRSDESDRHAIEVFRCYADKLVQVAEYCTTRPETYQVAWVMCHLAGSYKNVWINLEVNGPGAAVMDELRHLKNLLSAGVLTSPNAAVHPEVFNAVKWYLYHKPDSMAAGYVYNWKMNLDNKLTVLNQMRDSYLLRQLRVRSLPLLAEMETMVQEGSTIEGSGRNHDDRVIATCLATKSWIDWVRGGMIATNYTYEAVTELERQKTEHPEMNMIAYAVQDFFKQNEEKRERMADARAWAGAEVDW
jgi:hypothetical protein